MRKNSGTTLYSASSVVFEWTNLFSNVVMPSLVTSGELLWIPRVRVLTNPVRGRTGIRKPGDGGFPCCQNKAIVIVMITANCDVDWVLFLISPS